MKTPQEIFDQVSKHLIKQNKKATKDSFCSYRGEDGSKCAVGCLIPDELYLAAPRTAVYSSSTLL